MSGVSQRAYARHRGVTVRAVQKALETGRIKAGKDGKINAAAADAKWGNVDVHQHARGIQTPRGFKRGEGPPAPGPRGTSPDAPAMSSSMAKAQAVRMTYQAKLAQLDYEQRIGKMVSAEDVKAAAFEAARRARDQLLNIPDRLAPMVAGLDDLAEIRERIEREIRKVCAELGAAGGERQQ